MGFENILPILTSIFRFNINSFEQCIGKGENDRMLRSRLNWILIIVRGANTIPDTF